MYQLSQPTAELAPFIERYWFVHADATRPLDLTVDVFVDARADLVFNFGVPYSRQVLGEPAIVQKESNLDAQRTRPITIAQKGAIVITGVRFHTAGLSPFVGGAVSEWTDRVVPIAEVFGPEVEAVSDGLRATGADVRAQTAMLDAWLGKRLALTPQKQLVQTLKSKIETEGGQVRMRELSESASISIRQLDRLFKAHVGVGPKTFARIIRFQRGLSMLTRDPGCTLADVAAACGYYDQSHFVREFRQYAGVAPRAQVGYFPSDAPTDFSPNLVQFVQARREK
jgi:AraC-like DNA-binding protein